MSLKIALAGNPNCGKTTVFNELTGSSQYVGNWPGVTVEKKEGKLISHEDISIIDLPGIYSLSPYTAEEIVTREYLINEKPDCILNIIDGTNIERNLYLTTQLIEIGLPIVIAINMMDIVENNGDYIDIEMLSTILHSPILPIKAISNEGLEEVINTIIKEAHTEPDHIMPHCFTGSVEHSLAHIEESIQNIVNEKYIRWFAIKIFERDKQAYETLNINPNDLVHLESHIIDCEKELKDTSISIISNERYDYIKKIINETVAFAKRESLITLSDKIDRILTHKVFAIPIFALIMYVIYSIAMGKFGTSLTNWMSDVLISDIISKNLEIFLLNINVENWLIQLIINGIIKGVGTVISFIPQMILLFIFISILEDSGYMSRVGFIFDRLFRKFGLSGKSFIPMLVGTGCGVPAIMSCRTIEDEKDKRLTIILTTFIPCTAKMEIILLISQIFFNGNSLVATSMYFIGILIVIVSGIILKKFYYFSKDPIPFVIELPSYHIPTIKGIWYHVKERIIDFITKAGSVIFIACIISWILMNFNFQFQMVGIENSILKTIGEKICFIFTPLGFGNWQCAVASISAEIAKEQATATLSMIASYNGTDHITNIKNIFNNNAISALSFAIFNLFNAPCMVAISTAFREQNSFKWGFITFSFQMLVGYIVAFIVYNIGLLIFFKTINLYTILSFIILILILILIIKPSKYVNQK